MKRSKVQLWYWVEMNQVFIYFPGDLSEPRWIMGSAPERVLTKTPKQFFKKGKVVLLDKHFCFLDELKAK